LTVVTVSHSKSEDDYTIQTPSRQNCNVNGNSVNCTEYNGGHQQKALYWFTEVARIYPTGPTYTLRRRAQWV
jgi:hypothetical protein